MGEESDDFNLFDDFSNDEEAINNERRKQMQASLASRLSSFSKDPTPQKVLHLFTSTECAAVVKHCRELNGWTTARHSAFPTTDIPIRNTPLEYLVDMVRTRLFPQLAACYGFHPTRDLDFRDVFLVKYAADAQRGLKMHTDGCLVSFNVLISHHDDFLGGGTYFQSIDSDIQLEQGDCVFHDARIMHRGIDITEGERYILVGFVDTVDTIMKDKAANIRTMA